jgi:glycosyltransferase involved in cell wall biosynthesis
VSRTEASAAPLPAVLFAHAGAEMYGADRILLELAAGLKGRGHAVQVVLPGPGPLHAEMAAVGVQTFRRNLGVLRRRYISPLGLLNRLCRVLGSTWFMAGLARRLKQQHGAVVVHSNTTGVLSGVLAARLAGVPHVWHVHEITTRPRWFAKAMAHAVGWLSTRAVFVSAATRDHMCALGRRVQRQAVVIHNGIDTTRALQGRRGVLRAECGFDESHLVVGMVGRINWWKGQGRLLDCAALLMPSDERLRFLMVGGIFEGEDHLRDKLVQRMAELQVGDRVVVQDFRPDVGNVLADIDIFVLPSVEPDPFPTVVLEAMAAGKPVVAFRHGGVCEMVEDGVSGLLCPPVDAQAMAQAIQRLAASPELRQQMGQAGRERLQRLFTREAFLQRFSSLYQDLAARHRA